MVFFLGGGLKYFDKILTSNCNKVYQILSFNPINLKVSIRCIILMIASRTSPLYIDVTVFTVLSNVKIRRLINIRHDAKSSSEFDVGSIIKNVYFQRHFNVVSVISTLSLNVVSSLKQRRCVCWNYILIYFLCFVSQPEGLLYYKYKMLGFGMMIKLVPIVYFFPFPISVW